MGSISVALFVLLLGCGGRAHRPHGAPVDAGEGPTDSSADGDGRPIGETPLWVTDVVPDHGPATGGNVVRVRGDGLDRGGAVTVRFGDADAGKIVVVSRYEIEVRSVPAGPVGTVDVRVDIGGATTTLTGAYSYDPFRVEPPTGPTLGGTPVDVFGTDVVWGVDAIVLFDGAPADCALLAHDHLDCGTPPGEIGTADVRVVDGSGAHLYDATVRDAFEYTDPGSAGGGFFGGPIDGQIVVTVLSTGASPLPDAFVMLGLEDGPYQGETDAEGRIVFEGKDLVGPQTLTVGRETYESTTIVDFDANDVTVMLGWLGDGGRPPAGRPGVRGTLLEPWALVPEPLDYEERVCLVDATVGSSLEWRPSLQPERVTELDEGRYATSRSGYAVWALCGLESTRSGVFQPYAMGVARGVTPWDDEETDIPVDLPLDHAVVGRLDDPPDGFGEGAVSFRDEIFIDLGSDGVIARPDARVSSFDPTIDFRFAAQPPFEGPLADASFRFLGAAGDRDERDAPVSVVALSDVTEVDAPIVLGGFLGVPRPISPAPLEPLVDRSFSWDVPGSSGSFQVLYVLTNDLVSRRLWSVFLAGSARACTLPDLAAIAGLPDHDPGFHVLVIREIRVAGREWSDFRYEDLDLRRAEAWSSETSLFDWR